ncbi:MAG: bifunctional oligoribonuclease/PAP phosphatase NrnA [Oscillospiraceae bacterium]|nr:bifunctional oligoribonuclease/PAP phosphatase NrnA [Oscillospiraceae bacterium]
MIDLKTAAKMLKEMEEIAVLCHKDPDGDTLGSGAALVFGLKALGKQAALYCADPIPEKYAYFAKLLPAADFSPRFAVSVDVADEKLLGSLKGRFNRVALAIDHHGSHRDFAENTLVRREDIACAMVVFDLLKELGISLTKPMADALYTGIVTDSGCFLYPATSPKTHRMAAELMELGADFAGINHAMFETKNVARLALEKHCLSEMSLHFSGKCALSVLRYPVLHEIGAAPADFDGLAALPRQIEGVEVGLFARETEPGHFKISCRTNDAIDASAFCGFFDGGGHFHAAGCQISGEWEKVKEQLLARAEELLGQKK